MKTKPNTSHEELKIRKELESEIEGELEEEIKDEIFGLAIRLHRLYQHQKERTLGCNKMFSEVNICIKMEGGTKIEIKEMKKMKKNADRRVNVMKPMLVSSCIDKNDKKKKFNWAESLRSGENDNDDCNNGNRSVDVNKVVQLGWRF